jgi:hypothetical protein
LTNSAVLTWAWRTNYWLDTSNNGSGGVNVADAWCGAGSNIAITAAASNNWHFTGWSGDTSGCTIVDTVITAAMTQARAIAATFAIDQKTLTVVSAYGNQNPGGTITNNWGSALACYITNATVLNGSTTQYLANGGAVLSNLANQVSDTNITLTLTNSAVLTWAWRTNYWLDTSITGTGAGTVNVADAWCGAGSNIAITATASNNWHFTGWSGDITGCAIVDTVITAAMTQARAITATFAIDQKTLTVISAYDGTSPGTTTNDYGTDLNCYITNSPVFNGSTTQYLANGGAVLSNGFAIVSLTNITLTLTNNATLTWQWQTNYRFVAVADAHGSVTGDITNIWHSINSSVTVTAVPATYYQFAAWTGQVSAIAITNNPVVVTNDRPREIVATFTAALAANRTPHLWLAQYGILSDFDVAETNDPDHDGLMTWREYVAGTDPTNAQSVFRIFSEVRQGGSNVVKWIGGTNGAQTPYFIWYTTNLATNPISWTPAGTNATRVQGTNFWVDLAPTNIRYYYRVTATN